MSGASSEGLPAFVSLRHDDLFLAETIGTLGFDGVIVDLQHGPIGYEQMYRMLTALGGTSARVLVRIPSNDAGTAMKALDAGAQAVVCPGIGSADEAASFVGACRYPPVGYRSLGANRAGLTPGYAAGANDAVQALAAIDSPAGYAALEEILGVDGLDGVILEGDRDQVLGCLEAATRSGKTVLATVDQWPLEAGDLPPCGVVVRDDVIYRGAFSAAASRLIRAATGSSA